MINPQFGIALYTRIFSAIAVLASLAACGDTATLQSSEDTGANPTLPQPVKRLIPTVNIAPAKGWPQGAMPTAMAGLTVMPFATGLEHPRWVYVLPNGDVLVAESNAPPKPDSEKSIKGTVMNMVMSRAGAKAPSANRITLLRDRDGDGKAEVRTVFLENLMSPFGMALIGNDFYVANADSVVKFPYQPDATSITAAPVKVVDLPGGPINHHWTKNLIASPDGNKLYVTVGSNSNVGERGMVAEEGRAAIWEVDTKTGAHRIFASGLRNPNGMGWSPEGGALWTVVNERDEIGSDLVPDYLTSVKDGAFYGWPYAYLSRDRLDPRLTQNGQSLRPDLVAKTRTPDVLFEAHSAALGLRFYNGNTFPQKYRNGAFVAFRGSWNRSQGTGYKIVFVPFSPTGRSPGYYEDFLTGFLLDPSGPTTWGRPVGLLTLPDGSLLVTEEANNRIYRVQYTGG